MAVVITLFFAGVVLGALAWALDQAP